MNILYSIYGVRKALLVIQNLLFNIWYRARFHKPINIFGFPIILLKKGSQITVGSDLTLISACYFSEPGINHPVILRTTTPSSQIIIGNHVGMSGASIVAGEKIQIGDGVLIGANVVISDTDFHPIMSNERRYSRTNIQTSPITIGDNVFIGMNSLILKGVRIGKNSVIGAGSIVTSDIPEDCIAAGVPARILKNLNLAN